MRVLLRADGDGVLGAGHVMRMIALGQWITDRGGQVLLASAHLDESLEQRARSRGISISRRKVEPGSDEDIRWVIAQAERDSEWVAADGYQFREAFQEEIRRAGIRLLLLDDYGHCERYCADLVLNQNVSAEAHLYDNRAEHTRLLLGPAYALLRREFIARRSDPNPAPDRASRILVSMGGADPVDATRKAIAALGQLSDPALHARVVVGPSNSHAKRLIASARDPRIELLSPPESMADLMAWADLAISGAGSTAYELCFMGVPTLLVVLAANQLEVARAMDREGVCVNLGWHHELEVFALAGRVRELCSARDERQAMILRGRDKVDGLGGARVLEAMRGLS